MNTKQNLPINRGHVQLLFMIIGLLLLLLVPFLYKTHPPKVNSIKTAGASFQLDPALAASGPFSTFSRAGKLTLPTPASTGSQNQSPAEQSKAEPSVKLASASTSNQTDQQKDDNTTKSDNDSASDPQDANGNTPASSSKDKADN